MIALRRRVPNYRDILNEEFERRRALRSRYSLSTFARVIGVSRPHLLLVLEGKRGLSPKVAGQIAEKLKLGVSRKSVFLASVEALHSRSPITRRQAKSFLKSFKEVDDGPGVGSSWLVHAVWVLVDMLPELPEKTLEITAARLLGVSTSAVGDVLDQLLNSKMIERRGDNLKCSYGTDVEVTNGSNNYFVEAIQQGVKAIADRRRHWAISSCVFGINRSRKDEAIKMIRNFADQLYSTFHTDTGIDDVLLLNVHLFSLLREPISKPSSD